MDILNDLPKCSSYGCKVEVPVELEKEGLCVAHFLMTAESECAAIRREAMPVTGPDPKRRTEIEEYVSTSAAKLVSVGTGSIRLSDETKKRILTIFLSLMILRESLDRTTNCFRPRRKLSKAEPAFEAVAAAS